MTIIYRPHCGNCGYTFEKLHGTTAKEPPYCPQCKEPIKNILYFVSHRDKESFDYSKEFADNYAKELEKKYETR